MKLLVFVDVNNSLGIDNAAQGGGVDLIACELLVVSVGAHLNNQGHIGNVVYHFGFNDLHQALDFGGIGKGYALDECRKILESEQFDLHEWLLDAGSSTILVSGGPWPLGVGGPFKHRTRLPSVEKLSGGALSGSGIEIQGAHIWDVRRGVRETRWEQCWATAPTGAVADALTTAAMSLSPDELRSAAESLEARVLVARRQPEWMDRFRDPLAWYG
jgi:thiamine biosynthesis lipoprotein ApbE